ncbi:succinate dehydrogenase flavoprotein [Paludibacter propionicigenes WB4]|uniref:Succinate dehydrogenase flavoprotein n=1 Tax=Paludibacter propionicigenes (strain DSM 17365 / JCM 13257 / WB4) TaxID=694427 RepID=E4T6G8_PALPW|nr:succinate dehydrogenase flavoprotein [Paludibacter propionicigenes WB4]
MFIVYKSYIFAIIHNKKTVFNSNYVSQIPFRPTLTSRIVEITKAY